MHTLSDVFHIFIILKRRKNVDVFVHEGKALKHTQQGLLLPEWINTFEIGNIHAIKQL